MSLRDSLLVLAWLAIILNGLAIMGVIRQLRLLARRDSGSIIDSAVGRSVAMLAPWQNALVMFASASCNACRDIVPLLISSARDLSPKVVFRDEGFPIDMPAENVQRDRFDLFAALGITATPHVVVVEAGQIVLSRPVGSQTALQNVLEAARSIQRRGDRYRHVEP